MFNEIFRNSEAEYIERLNLSYSQELLKFKKKFLYFLIIYPLPQMFLNFDHSMNLKVKLLSLQLRR